MKIEAWNARPSECLESTGTPLDVDVEVRIGRRTISGEVTLICDRTGHYAAWGQPDHWISGDLLAALPRAYGRGGALVQIEYAAAAVADAWSAPTE